MSSKDKPQKSSEINSELEKSGFARFHVDEMLGSSSAEMLLADLKTASNDLPVDPYCPTENRFRRYARFTFLPWSGLLVPWSPVQDVERGPVTTYCQEAELNPDENASGLVREFAAFPEALASNPLLHDLIRADYGLISWGNQEEFFEKGLKSVLVGVHMVRIEATPGVQGLSSPNCLHQDGEPFTFVHLIERANILGGVNVLAPPDFADQHPNNIPAEAKLADFTIYESFESYGVFDAAVSHYVGELDVEPGQKLGWRTVLLIDFTPQDMRLSK